MVTTLIPRLRDDDLIALAAMASHCHDSFVFDRDDQAAAAAAASITAGVTEFQWPYCQGLMIGDTLAALLTILPGPQVSTNRLLNARALASLDFCGPGSAVRRRAALAGRTFQAVSPTDFYLSRLAVDPRHRGQGLGRQLLEHAEGIARQGRAMRLLLDVASNNRGALRLYLNFGYEQVGESSVEDPATSRAFAHLHLAKRMESS